MAVFSQRSFGYKMGLILTLLSVVCYLTGFSVPYWTVYRASYVYENGDDTDLSEPHLNQEIRGHNGLWETCGTGYGFSSKMCASISQHRGHPAWMSGVQGLQCLGLIGLITASLYAGGLNFLLQKPVNNRYLEILLLSGLFGFTGSTIYAAQSYGNNQLLTLEGDYEYNLHDLRGIDKLVVNRNELGWAYALNLTGSLLALISAMVICAQNHYIPEESAQAVASVSFSAAGAATGGALVFLPPEYLAAGVSPPPYRVQDSSAAENRNNPATDSSAVEN